MAALLTGWMRRQAERWLFRLGAPEPGEVFLHRRRIFIVPSKAGVAYAGLLAVLLVASVNYDLGLGFGLTFMALACGLVDMVFTYRNLAHLRLRCARVPDVFAGEQARFELLLINRTRLDRYAVRMNFPGRAGRANRRAYRSAQRTVDILAGASSAVELAVPAPARGLLQAPRVRLTTGFPLGLFTAWCYWEPDAQALVYPAPEMQAVPLPLAGQAAGDGGGGRGHDDFAGVRGYQAGDPMRHLAWRQIARLDPALGGQLATKQFEGSAARDVVLDFNVLDAALDLELRLSRMTRWVLDAERRALPYAFALGALHLAPACGPAHQAACLRALARFGLPGTR